MVHSLAGPSVVCTALLTDEFGFECKQNLSFHQPLADISMKGQNAIDPAEFIVDMIKQYFAFLLKADIVAGNT